jgi:hypothetical protein
MIFRTTQKEVDTYFSDKERISQSKLKKIIKGVEGLKDVTEKELYYEEKEHLIIGSAVDDLLTMGKEVFDNTYYVTIAEKPSGKTLSVLHRLFDNVLETYGENLRMANFGVLTEELIESICLLEDFQGRWKLPAKINALEKNSAYFDELCQAYGKQIITIEDKAKIDSIAESFKNSDYGWIFKVANGEENENYDEKNIDIYFQKVIYFDYDGIPSKALLDLLLINHNTKEIAIADLKTTGDTVINFKYAAMKFRYDIQAAFYINAVTKWIKTKPELKDYTLIGFSFLVESTIVQNGAISFECSDEFLEMGSDGRPAFPISTNDGHVINYPKIKGVADAISDYIWYLENGFERERLIVEEDGVLVLGWNRYIN